MPTSIPITYKNGQIEQFSLVELDVYQRHQFTNLIAEGQTPQIVELCCGRKPDWVRSLSFKSYLDLARHCINENFQYAMEIAQHDPVAGLRIGPLVMRMAAVSELLHSGSSSPTPGASSTSTSISPTMPPPAAAAPETPAPATA